MDKQVSFPSFEATVVELYDLGTINQKALDLLAQPYQKSNFFSVSQRELKAKDGKTLEEIVVATIEPEQFQALTCADQTTYWDTVLSLFDRIWTDRWQLRFANLPQ